MSQNLNEKQIKQMYEWRQNHPEKYLEICKKGVKIYYEKNKENIRRKNLENYYKRKALKLLEQQNNTNQENSEEKTISND
jgi:hypothetical protein